jgi:hypothetical protein
LDFFFNWLIITLVLNLIYFFYGFVVVFNNFKGEFNFVNPKLIIKKFIFTFFIFIVILFFFIFILILFLQFGLGPVFNQFWLNYFL